MTLEEASGPPVEVWPDNWSAVMIFDQMGTQWRYGPYGRSGLDYNALPAVMRLARVHPAERSDVFDSIRILENSALSVMRGNK